VVLKKKKVKYLVGLNLDDSEREARRQANLRDLARIDPSYTKTGSYQKAIAKTSGTSKSSAKASSSTSGIRTWHEGMTKEETPYAQLESGKGPFAESARRGAERVAITAQYNPQGLTAALNAPDLDRGTEMYKEASAKAVQNKMAQRTTSVMQASAVGDLIGAGLLDADMQGNLKLTLKGQNLGPSAIYALEDNATWGKAFDFYIQGNDVEMLPEGTRASLKKSGIKNPTFLEKDGKIYLVAQKEGQDTIEVQDINPFTNILNDAAPQSLAMFFDDTAMGDYENPSISYSVDEGGISATVKGYRKSLATNKASGIGPETPILPGLEGMGTGNAMGGAILPSGTIFPEIQEQSPEDEAFFRKTPLRDFFNTKYSDQFGSFVGNVTGNTFAGDVAGWGAAIPEVGVKSIVGSGVAMEGASKAILLGGVRGKNSVEAANAAGDFYAAFPSMMSLPWTATAFLAGGGGVSAGAVKNGGNALWSIGKQALIGGGVSAGTQTGVEVLFNGPQSLLDPEVQHRIEVAGVGGVVIFGGGEMLRQVSPRVVKWAGRKIDNLKALGRGAMDTPGALIEDVINLPDTLKTLDFEADLNARSAIYDATGQTAEQLGYGPIRVPPPHYLDQLDDFLGERLGAIPKDNMGNTMWESIPYRVAGIVETGSTSSFVETGPTSPSLGSPRMTFPNTAGTPTSFQTGIGTPRAAMQRMAPLKTFQPPTPFLTGGALVVSSELSRLWKMSASEKAGSYTFNSGGTQQKMPSLPRRGILSEQKFRLNTSTGLGSRSSERWLEALRQDMVMFPLGTEIAAARHSVHELKKQGWSERSIARQLSGTITGQILRIGQLQNVGTLAGTSTFQRMGTGTRQGQLQAQKMNFRTRTPFRVPPIILPGFKLGSNPFESSSKRKKRKGGGRTAYAPSFAGIDMGVIEKGKTKGRRFSGWEIRGMKPFKGGGKARGLF
jgi:hypothetical protein